MTTAYSQLIAALNALRRRWRGRTVVTGALFAAAAFGAALVLTVAVDNIFKLSQGGRLVWGAVAWLSLLVGGWRFVVRRARVQRSDDFFAALVEQRHPELGNRLINALQLGRENGVGLGSPRLVEAIVNDAASVTADMDLADALESRELKQAGLAVAAAVVVLVAYALVLTPRFVNGLERVLVPLASIPPYSATQITSVTGNARVPERATVVIEGRISGVMAESAQLVRRAADKPWQVVQVQEQAKFSLPEVTESFDYYLAAGDGRSATYHVEVVPRPQIVGRKVRYQLPAYTQQPAGEWRESNGEWAGLAGTQVEVELTANKPLQEAALVTGARVVPLSAAADKHLWRGSFVIWSTEAKAAGTAAATIVAPTRYHARLLDTDGYENTEPVWQSITLLRDQPPTVSIVTPGRDVQVKPDETVQLTVEAQDDYGIGEGRLVYRLNEQQPPQVLVTFSTNRFGYAWKLAERGLKPGDLVQYWAEVADRNDITGPGRAVSRRFSIYLINPPELASRVDGQIGDDAQVLEELLRRQRENRAQTASGVAFEALITRQANIRGLTTRLARALEKGAVPLATMVASLDELAAGPMADVIRMLESQQRELSLPVQDRIIAGLQGLLARLQRNEQARDALRKLVKTDQAAHDKIAEVLTKMTQDLGRLLAEAQPVSGKFERLPKLPLNEYNEPSREAAKSLVDFQKKLREWLEGKVDELTKLPTGFVDDFSLRQDLKQIFEEIEKAAQRQAATKVEVAIEDTGDPTGKNQLTRMKEDLEAWMPDAPDSAQWILEEPYVKADIPEMALPDGLQDMVGDLLEKEEEFDQQADDITSAWGTNLDQAGWLATDGNESSFSAKGITGNDLPNSNELSGRSGDGRRGKSSGQMVGDTSRALKGRRTPARVTGERYEPGQLKQQGQDDPEGATGGGKKAGASERGLQGGTPPDFVKDMERLRELQRQIREKTQRISQQLEATGASSSRLDRGIELMKSIEQDYRDLRYDDAARKRRMALTALSEAKENLLDRTGVQLSRARQLPAAMREEIIQATDEGYPPGYEEMLKSYYRALSEAGK